MTSFAPIPGLKEDIECKAFEFGYSLGKAGIDLESREGLNLTGKFIVKLFKEDMTKYLMQKIFESVAQEVIREMSYESYAGVVRRGIEALGEGRL